MLLEADTFQEEKLSPLFTTSLGQDFKYDDGTMGAEDMAKLVRRR